MLRSGRGRPELCRTAASGHVNPLATRIGVAYSDIRYRRVHEFAERDHHCSMFVAQSLGRGRHLDLTARVQYENRNLHEQ